MKILYGITKGNWGGAQKQVFDLATALAQAGNDVSVVFGGLASGTELQSRLTETKIPSIVLRTMDRDINFFKEIRSFISLIKILRRERPDVLHLHSPKMGGLGGLAGRITGLPRIIYTAHGWTFNEERPWIQKWLIAFFSWLIILCSHQTIVLSEKEKKQVVKWPFVKKKIIVIPNGIKNIDFLDRVDAEKSILSSSLSALPPRPWVVTIAELHKNKGLTYAIEAVSLLPQETQLTYFIIGEGEERSQLEKLIDEKGLKSRVFLLGFHKNASKLLKAFDLFLFPSIKEGFPYALLEASQAGLPIIASAVGQVWRYSLTKRLVC